LTPLIPLAPKGLYKHWGKSYVVKPTRMRGSGPSLQAVAAGELDFGGMSVQALTLGVKRAKLDLRVIAQVMSGGVDGWASSEFMVRKDSGINSFKDVKGKIVAVNAFGGTVDAAIRAMASRAGLKPGRDFQVVEVRFPAMLPALQSKRIDLTILVTPFNLIAMRKGGFKQLFTMRDALGATETLSWIGKASYIKKNRAALVDFLEDNMRFRKWLYDPKNKDARADLISKVTKRPAKNYKGWAFTRKDNYRDLHAMTNVARMQKNANDLNKLGVLKPTIDVSKYVDMSLAEEAARRFK
jgi:sulfonate transport system substrate-binding protein